MVMKTFEIDACEMTGVLAKTKENNASTYDWKVDHINEVGLKQCMRIQEMPTEDLKNHFRRLMKPSNIVLVPSALKGLGDMPAFINHIKEKRA